MLSPYAQRLEGLRGRTRLDRRDKDDENAWCEILIEDRTAGPAETAMARIDVDLPGSRACLAVTARSPKFLSARQPHLQKLPSNLGVSQAQDLASYAVNSPNRGRRSRTTMKGSNAARSSALRSTGPAGFSCRARGAGYSPVVEHYGDFHHDAESSIDLPAACVWSCLFLTYLLP